MEIDDRFRLLKPGMSVLDLGAAPGSWSQYAAEQVGPKGKVTSVDLSEIEPIEGVTTFVADITDNDALDKILPEMVGLVISDLAPKTSGIQDVDQWKSIELSQSVLETVRKRLKPGGKCVIKVLRGADFDEFLKECKEEWTEVKTFQARASRDRSKEIYVILTN
jgi:23S rRNA (uridine2552-2'-O)-methyltransferase